MAGQPPGALASRAVERRGAIQPEVFRPRGFLAVSMGVAGLLWVAVLVYLLTFHGVPLKTFLSTFFFIAFFGVSHAYYARAAIEVDAGGVTYRGMVRTERFAFGDILHVDVWPGPVTVYAIRAQGRGVHFTSFFMHHRRLVALLVEHAGLAPQRS